MVQLIKAIPIKSFRCHSKHLLSLSIKSTVITIKPSRPWSNVLQGNRLCHIVLIN